MTLTNSEDEKQLFLFFMPDEPTWTREAEHAFQFRSHSDAESNARLILERLEDPTNAKLGLKSGDGERMLPVNVMRKA